MCVRGEGVQYSLVRDTPLTLPINSVLVVCVYPYYIFLVVHTNICQCCGITWCGGYTREHMFVCDCSFAVWSK